ncbi:MAG: NADPH-dependent assimilatory sulfite reductase hemoprotein subunit [Alphaproteobacteria bacterium]
MTDKQKLSHVEHVKIASRGLRGDIAKTIADDSTDKFNEDDEQLTKFHGFYQGYNRDTATARKKQGLDKEWEMMLRAKLPGGRISAYQYLALDALCDKFSNETLRVTSRQGLQFHCVMKGDIHPLINEINQAMITTLGGCGDVVRNVMAVPSPLKIPAYTQIQETANAISDATLPTTTGYHEMWIEGKKYEPAIPADEAKANDDNIRVEKQDTIDPLYGTQWMPRKFKIGIAVPEDNTVDALTNDLGLIAIYDENGVQGYNMYIGGGFGMKHNNANTYPRIATPLGYVPADEIIEACHAVIKFQRDHGDRGDRQHARLKYVVEENGMEFCTAEIEKHFGKPFAPIKDFGKLEVKNHLGWQDQGDGKFYLGVPVTSGRIKNTDEFQIRTAFRKLAEKFDKPMIMMPTEDVIFCDIEEGEKAEFEAILREHNVERAEDHLPVELWAMSCVALPTCGKALTEGERARVPITTMVADTLKKYGLEQERLAVRITGCPNGCSRPYVGDIGIVGRAPNLYAMYIGGDFEGTRLNHKVADMVKVDKIGDFLAPFFAAFKSESNDNEGFGDFCDRIGDERRKELAASSGAAKKL